MYFTGDPFLTLSAGHKPYDSMRAWKFNLLLLRLTRELNILDEGKSVPGLPKPVFAICSWVFLLRDDLFAFNLAGTEGLVAGNDCLQQ